MKIKQLVYISVATTPFSADGLKELTEVANKNNKRLAITGCMVYASGYFLQLLEGEDAAVEMLYQKITKDPRHKGTKVLLNQEVDEAKRLFPNWFMTSFNVDTRADFPDELKQRIKDIVSDPKATLRVHRLFMEFKQYLAG